MTKNNEPEHGSLVSRSSIDSRFQWNINDIYPDQESWKTASQQFKKDVDAFSQYKGQLHDCQTLKTVLREQEKLSIIISKLYAYARLQQDTDNANQQFQLCATKVTNPHAMITTITIYTSHPASSFIIFLILPPELPG